MNFKQDWFHYFLVYDPQQKTLVADRGEMGIGTAYQAQVPKTVIKGRYLLLRDVSCFKIIDNATSFYQLKIKESFHIERLEPELNKQVDHVSLALHF